ncbi:MAG: T9SS type A sorting domain-containing protein [Sphingomonadales bacterium]
MKKLLLSVSTLILAAASFAQIKYVDPIYAENTVQITKNVSYATHISILPVLSGGSPAPENLTMDIYSSSGNTDAKKPLVIFLHTGNFLPRYVNNGTTGARDDSATVAFCKKLAQRGYVVASMSYRLGWNPTSPNENVRRETIINAAYRGVQDLAACVRYFKKDAKNTNTFAVDSTKIAVGGQGTGGYVTLAYATLDRQAEIRLEKFYNLDAKRWMVEDSLKMGDRLGFKIPGTVGALVIENHKGYTSNVAIAFNIGGALGDSSWLEKGSLPIISAHGIQDPFAPYKLGVVSVPGTNPPLNVVDVSGSYDVMQRTNKYGNNASYKGKVMDVYTIEANKLNKGLDGLFPIAGAANGSGPYEWWDTAAIKALGIPNAATVIANGNATNPLHKIYGKSRAIKYVDSIMGYVSPRLAVSMGLVSAVGLRENNLGSNVTVAPNPAKNQVVIHNNWTNRSLVSAELVDLNGRSVQKMNLSPVHNVVSLNASAGIYMLRLQFNDGAGVQKLIIE